MSTEMIATEALNAQQRCFKIAGEQGLCRLGQKDREVQGEEGNTRQSEILISACIVYITQIFTFFRVRSLHCRHIWNLKYFNWFSEPISLVKTYL